MCVLSTFQLIRQSVKSVEGFSSGLSNADCCQVHWRKREFVQEVSVSFSQSASLFWCSLSVGW